jgi:hypothetical protein
MNPSTNANSIGNSLGNSMSKSISNGSPLSTYGQSTLSSSNVPTGSFFSRISWVTWIIIIMVLAFLGFNIFLYLAKGTQYLTNTFGPIISLISTITGNLAANTTKQVVSTSATGSKAGIDVAANTVNSGVTSVQQLGSNIQGAGSASNIIPLSTDVTTSPSSSSSSSSTALQNNPLNNALNSAQQQQQQQNTGSSYQADDSYSRIQSSNSSGKAGWCYIGEERGVRSCSQVGANDTCMSGDIFPSNEVCMNPNMAQN